MKLQEENTVAKSAYEALLEEHNKLKKQHAEDNGKDSCVPVLVYFIFLFIRFELCVQKRRRKPLTPRLKRTMISLQK